MCMLYPYTAHTVHNVLAILTTHIQVDKNVDHFQLYSQFKCVQSHTWTLFYFWNFRSEQPTYKKFATVIPFWTVDWGKIFDLSSMKNWENQNFGSIPDILPHLEWTFFGMASSLERLDQFKTYPAFNLKKKYIVVSSGPLPVALNITLYSQKKTRLVEITTF